MRERNYTLGTSLECFQNRWKNVSRIIECAKKKRQVYVCLSLLLFKKRWPSISNVLMPGKVFFIIKIYEKKKLKNKRIHR